MRNNITANYKKCTSDMVADINIEASALAKSINMADRIEGMSQTNAFILLKDHKVNFNTDTKSRLINPAKPQLGKVSSQMLQQINKAVREATGLKQWRSTSDALQWFDNIDKKRTKEFVQLDIIDFYPSISKTVLEKAIRFARNYCHISQTTENIIYNSRKTVLFSGGEQWVKKDDVFDVSMGAFDGAEVAELVGLLILHKLKIAVPKIDFGLYRDDGLGENEPLSGPKREQSKKKIFKTMKDLGFDITLEFGLKIVDYLDATLDLNTSAYKPFRKPNDTPCYINKHSNHPPNTTKQLPKMVNTRLCSISSNKTVFDEAAPIYQAALDKSGYKHKLSFEPIRPKNRQRKKQVTWYNPPFNASVSTNIGKQFLKLIDKHFPPNRKRKDKLEKIINRHTIKISYSGTQSMAGIIANHNSKIMKERTNAEETTEKCNCQKGIETCPLQGKCLTSSVVYKATVKTSDGEIKTYTGCTDRTFKKRHYGHVADAKDSKHRNNTELAGYIWDKKDIGVNIDSIKWEILKKCHKYQPGGKKCDVCLSEKLCIMKDSDPTSLNKRSELMNTCRHRWKWRLDTVKRK